MSVGFVEDLSQLGVTELRQLIIALCLDPKTKKLAIQHLDMTAHMKSINAQEAHVSDEESITDHNSEPFEKGNLGCWDSPPPNDSDSDAEDTPSSSENHGWDTRTNYWDAWGEERKNTFSLSSPKTVEDNDWGYVSDPGYTTPGSDESSKGSASETASNIGGGSEVSDQRWCADCDKEFSPTSKWYGEFYGEHMPCRFHPGKLPTPTHPGTRLFLCLMRVC